MTEQLTAVRVVFNLETYPPTPLGTYAGGFEDTIQYLSPDGEIKTAPEDCVSIISVNVPTHPVPFVVVVRDPDASNDYRTWGLVRTYDIDAGYSDLRDEEEFREWEESHLESAAKIEESHPQVAEYIRDVVNSYRRG